MALSAALLTKSQKDTYVPRAENQLQAIFERHFDEFCAQYEERFAKKYGMYRLERLQDVGTRFRTCGDYLQGIARIRCTNPECGHDYFRPFSCKGFYRCPSCSQKRTLLFAEQLTEKVLLDLPHRQFVFTLPKALRVFFRHDRRLFEDISRLIFNLVREFYQEVAGRMLLTGLIVAHQTFGDMLRWNPHFHAIVLEGGFDNHGRFFYIPFGGLEAMVELFRRRVIQILTEKGLLDEKLSSNLLSWKHSGFSIDNSVRILDHRAQENLAEYIARPPISLKKIRYEPFTGRVLFHTAYSEYFKENVRCLGVHRRTDATCAAQRIAADSSIRVVFFKNEGTMGTTGAHQSAGSCRLAADAWSGDRGGS